MVQLTRLRARRDELLAELGRLEREIAALELGEQSPATAGAKNRRSLNERSLREHVLHFLRERDEGYRLSELHDLVLAAGYRTASANFRNILYQCLYNTKDVYHDEQTGCYRLKKQAGT